MYKYICLTLHFALACTLGLAQPAGFVSLVGRDFMLDGELFYPVAINFDTELQTWTTPVTDLDELFCTVGSIYDHAFSAYEHTSEAALDQQITEHFAKIRSMGFNTVRFGIPVIWNWNPADGPRRCSVVYYRHIQWERNLLDLDMNGYDDPASQRYFHLLRKLIRLADAEDLKVILLCAQANIAEYEPGFVPSSAGAQDYADYLQRLAQELKDEPGLLAYDLWNEPIWSNRAMARLTKEKVCTYTGQWYDAIRSADAHHLVTLGGASFHEFGSWDPAIMKLDFYSPHIYPRFSRLDGFSFQATMDRYRALLHWQSRSCPIPWLIGETAFAAEDDAVDPMDLANNSSTPILVADPRTKRMPYMMGSEAEQAEFFTIGMDAVRNYLGSGYSWWGFQNGRNHPLLLPESFTNTSAGHKKLVEEYHYNFWGPLKYGNPGGLNLPAPWNAQNRWRDKAMVAAMQNYSLPPTPTEMPPPPSNYYNWYNLNTNVWRDGYIKDQNNQPVADALMEVPWRYVLNLFNPPPVMPAWTFTEWMPYVTDQNGFFSIRKVPVVAGFNTPIEPTVLAPTVNAAGCLGSQVGGAGTTTFVQRDLLPYSAVVQVVVEENEARTYKGRVGLEVTSGTVDGGSNGGQADLFAMHVVHVSAPFHAEAGSKTHIYTTPVFADCPGEGSGMVLEPSSPSSSLGSAKRRTTNVELRFELPAVKVSVFPIPAFDHVTLQSTTPGFSYSIFDSNGRMVQEGQCPSDRTALDVGSLATGVYQCSITIASRIHHTSFTIAR
ncbi:MAG: hypothetical protein E6Q44_17040 [Flavobacteriales bacterium]|nr:MAG: hypothetical protein E6Q44_17040 [Flavobacteriales bacterium]